MFDSDLPIVKTEQDCLDRATFAKYLARCMLEHIHTESVVIGLYGNAKSGKTSLINLAREELLFASSNMFDDERPVIVNFNLWSESGQHRLLYRFFRRLAAEIRRYPYIENGGKIVSLLDLYSHIDSTHDLAQIKERINEFLVRSKHKLIIFIDNFSRIENKEVKEVFQLVKAIADFANTIYVLALDNNAAANSDLANMIQLPFQVPDISQQDSEVILLERLKPVMTIVPEESWDSHYWGDIYYTILRYFFSNVRDVTRYINTLHFSYARVKEVVNPVDFFAVTTIAAFEPTVYKGIRDNKDLFTDLMHEVYELDPEKIAEDRRRCDEVLGRCENVASELLKNLLIHLFPRLRRLYQADKIFYHSNAIARKNKRICSAEAFEAYFHLSIPTGEISASEMNAILAMVNDEEGFDLALSRLNHDGRARKFLALLDSIAIDSIPTQYAGNVMNALMDSADLIPEGESSLISFNTPMRVHRIFNQLLQRFETSEQRFALFQQAIERAIKSLYIIIHELTLQDKQHIETEDTYLPTEYRNFSPEQLITLKNLAVDKIVSWVKNQRLIEHPKLLEILYAWQAWGDASQCNLFVAQIIQENVGLLNFLVAALKEPIDQTMLKLEKRPEWEKYLAHIENFIPIKMVESRAKQIFEDIEFEKHREREQLAVLIFLDLIKADTVKLIPKTTV